MIKTKRMMVLGKEKTPQFTYNLKKGLRNWKTAYNNLLNGETEIYDVCVIGDSITEGWNQVSDYKTKGYVPLLNSYFQTLFDDVGRGMIPIFHPTGGTQEWTLAGGTWTEKASFGIALKCYQAYNMTGYTATFTFSGTGINLLIPKTTLGGDFTYSIDEGDSVTLNNYAGATNYLNLFEITGLNNGDHTIVITATNAQLPILGAYETKGTNGVRFHMVGRGGTTSTGNSNANSMNSAIDAQSPVLTVISLTCNDYSGQTALDTYKTQLQNIITEAKLYGDVLINTIGIHYQSYTIPQQEYWDVVFELAQENDIALVDIAAKWGYTSGSAYNYGFLPSPTQVHPGDQGHEDIARMLYTVLTKMI